MPTFVHRSLLLLAFACLAVPASAGELAAAAGRALDLTPERLAAFRTTLREFGAHLTVEEAQASGLDMRFEDVYESPFLDRSDDWLTEDVGPLGPITRDVVAEERFLIEERQDDFEDAAKKWLSRRLKGSDAGPDHGSRVSPKLGWNGGPVLGVRKGPLSASVGEFGWHVRFTKKLASHPGWVARVTAGVDDGEEKIAFTIGRSLLRSTEK